MEARIFCQSCGMPLDSEEVCGTEQNGSKSQEYCAYCYKGGAFTWDCSMDQMIDFCLSFERQQNPALDEAKAREGMMQWFPTLKRWKK